MELLPSSHTEFNKPDYWESFFKKRGKIPFEWYGEYPQLHAVIHKYITPSNSVLVVGCGNSVLSENMYDNGLQNLTNIDISEVVIRQMTERNKQKRPNMTFEKVDVTQMNYPDGHFHVVLDKGTLDALLVNEESQVVENVHLMFAQVARCLKLGGRYIVISLLQDHIQRIFMEYFSSLGWPVRVHKIYTESEATEKHKSLSMPVFAVVVTKLKPLPNMTQIVEVCRYEDRIDRLEDIKFLSAIVKDMQYYHMVRHQLRQNLPGDCQVSLELHSRDSATPRYNLTVVDSSQPQENKFAIFIVPQGRETEWLFSTDKGRLHLLESSGFQRLVVVTLNRGHEYENLDAIKAELSNKVMELAPAHCPPRSQIPFLSIGEDLGKRYPVTQGQSDISGEYLVEDIEMNGGQLFRRLVFAQNKNVVQSEARLTEVRKKKKRRQHQAREGPPGKVKVDKGYLSSDYLIAMVGGFGLLPVLDRPTVGVLVGLGGGVFPSFVHDTFPLVTLETVELDPTVVDIAQQWFDLTPDERLKLHIADGLEFIRQLAASGKKRNFVLLDVDSKDHSVGLSCPPIAFVEQEFLTTISKLLLDDGVFMLNLASRDETIKEDIIRRIQSVFSSCACVHLEEDINTIVYASNSPVTDSAVLLESLTPVFRKMDAAILSVWKDTNVQVEDAMSALKFLD